MKEDSASMLFVYIDCAIRIHRRSVMIMGVLVNAVIRILVITMELKNDFELGN